MADTSTVGGVISGYCATGSVKTRDAAGQRDDDRQHRGEDRPVDEEAGEHGVTLSFAVRAVADAATPSRDCRRGPRRDSRAAATSATSQRQPRRAAPPRRAEQPRVPPSRSMTYEEHRRQEDAEERHAEHAAEHRRAQRLPHLRPGAAWRPPAARTPRMNANDVIRIGRSRSWHASSVASRRSTPAVALELGELDDQDRVLARQADQHDEADLREDVDVRARPWHTPASEPSTHIGTTRITASGSDQLSYWAASTRNTNTTDEGEDRSCRCCRRLHLEVRRSRSTRYAMRRRQLLLGQLLHQRDRLAGADARRGVAVDRRRRVHVVARQDQRAVDLAARRPACRAAPSRRCVLRTLQPLARRRPRCGTARRPGRSTCQVRPKRLKSLTYSEPR